MHHGGARETALLFERKQVEVALRRRKRYRYVQPRVRAVAGGWIVDSPCCSRRVDPAGGMVDVALMQKLQTGGWRLYRKDHESAKWELDSVYGRLSELLDRLKEDPDRKFWQ